MTSVVNLEDLGGFLLAANEAGYAGGDAKLWAKEQDGSTTISFESGDWRSHDSFFGGEPYGGRTVVSFRSAPVWVMVYYGAVVQDRDANDVYDFLRRALREMPPEAPLRGPREFSLGGLVYTNSWDGEVAAFVGREAISQGTREIYQAPYAGGLVDQRRAV